MTIYEAIERRYAYPNAPGLWRGRCGDSPWQWFRVVRSAKAPPSRRTRSRGGLRVVSPYTGGLFELDIITWDPSVSPMPLPLECS